MRVGFGYRSPTRPTVRSPLYFNSVVTAVSDYRIVETKNNAFAKRVRETYENVSVSTHTMSHFYYNANSS